MISTDASKSGGTVVKWQSGADERTPNILSTSTSLFHVIHLICCCTCYFCPAANSCSCPLIITVVIRKALHPCPVTSNMAAEWEGTAAYDGGFLSIGDHDDATRTITGPLSLSLSLSLYISLSLFELSERIPTGRCGRYNWVYWNKATTNALPVPYLKRTLEKQSQCISTAPTPASHWPAV